MKNYLTREEIFEYAKLCDLIRVDERASVALVETRDLGSELRDVVRSYESVIGYPDECSWKGVGGYVGERLAYLDAEISQIKEVLLELQITLRTLGLDDMERRLGDLNLLLT